MTDEHKAAAEKAPEKEKGKSVSFVVEWPLNEFVHNIPNVPNITSTPTEVSPSKAQAVRDAAEAAGVFLQEV